MRNMNETRTDVRDRLPVKRPPVPNPQQMIPGTRRHAQHIIYELARSIEERDGLTYDHCRRVAIYANRLARMLNWTRSAARDLALAGLAHDLGKTWIGNAVLHKESALSHDERLEMQRHPVIAARILDIYGVPEWLTQVVLYHHEAYDGGGYPDGLVGEQIPHGARILTVVDVFDALTSARPYKAAMSAGEAQTWITRHSTTQFDPHVVEAFNALLDSSRSFTIAPLQEAPEPLETPPGL
jgi:HD-GYP domain-containing protein (c-di-GMP phosphodiesterase class II)